MTCDVWVSPVEISIDSGSTEFPPNCSVVDTDCSTEVVAIGHTDST